METLGVGVQIIRWIRAYWMFIAMLFILFLCVFFIGGNLIKLGNDISERGLKGILTDVWEGKQTRSE